MLLPCLNPSHSSSSFRELRSSSSSFSSIFGFITHHLFLSFLFFLFFPSLLPSSFLPCCHLRSSQLQAVVTIVGLEAVATAATLQPSPLQSTVEGSRAIGFSLLAISAAAFPPRLTVVPLPRRTAFLQHQEPASLGSTTSLPKLQFFKGNFR